MNCLNIFSPGKIGSIYLRNRIIMAPLGSRLTNENGGVTDNMIEFYSLRAKGGVGAIVIEAAGIDYPLAVGKPNHLRIHDDSYIPGHALLVEHIHEYGAKVFSMLWHTGINRGMFCGETPVGPSAILNPNTGITPRELSKIEIHDIVEKFGHAGKRAMLCGYDGVEVHGGHGYLVSSFVSRATNHRTDEYGGTLENRIRFALEIVESIRKNTRNDYPILFRINGDDFCKDGCSQEEAVLFAQALEKAGVAALDISAGVYSSIDRMIEPIQYEEGWKIYLAENIKKHVGIPVIGVGALHTPKKVNKLIEEGRIDFAALGRELLSEPFWVKKAQKNDRHLRYCLGCNTCFDRIGKNLPLRCAINPLAGRKNHRLVPVEAAEKKRIAVVGAGPGGITAAVYAARRGHTVDLYEKDSKIGGQLNLAAAPPNKDRINAYINYLEEELKTEDLKLHLGEEFTLETAKDGMFDEIVLATGAHCRNMRVEGAEDKTVTAWDVLEGKVPVQGLKVVLIGAGFVGCETALYLKEKGASQVTVVELREKIGMDIDMISRIKVLSELEEAKIDLQPLTTFESYDASNGTVKLKSAKTDNSWDIPCDLIVIATGAIQNNELADKLYQQGYRIHLIGDAVNIGKIGDSVHQGYNIASAL
ncbi:MAG: FAD-dependent oxidoreductase [Acetivibrionales bacterium]|jgi:2,4-dienoyl-CoA reductase-like NADH-dependent reductase (Old Yellow Enzyme family)/thioredoxin reductase